MPFIKTKGCLYLTIAPITVFQYLKDFYPLYKINETWGINRYNRDGSNYHITVINSSENIPDMMPINENYHIVGLKQTDDVDFLVVHFPAGDKYRKKHNLNHIDFHITLGWAKQDIHTICKSIECLSNCDMTYHNVDKKQNEYTFQTKEFYKHQTIPNKQYILMNKLYLEFPMDSEILASFIDIIVKHQQFEKANLLSYTLLELCPNKGAYSLLKICNELNSINEELIETIENKIISCNADEKYADFILKQLNNPKLINSNNLSTKYEWVIKNNTYLKLKKPRNCTEPYDKIFGSAILKNSHMDYIKHKNIECVINLMEENESEIEKEVLEYFKRNYYKFQIPDRSIVSLEKIDEIVDKMIEYYDNDQNILVHCMGGKGRTNMIIACFTMKKIGVNLSEILVHLKNTREYIVSREQLDLIKRYENQLLNTNDYLKKDKGTIRFNGKKCPKMFVLVGLPGSGKSTFSNHIVDNIKSIIRISQDDIGKKACHENILKNISNNNLIIIDRCNLKKSDRKEYCDYLKNDQKAWAIIFNTEPEECIYRAQNRPDHPTLKASGAEKIIKDLASKYENVSDNEGFEQIINIKSPDDLNFVLEQWNIPIIKEETNNDIIKFPRTRHLANIGGASREDLLLDQTDINEFLNNEIYIEEKIDGANMGISIEPDTYKILFQNRSHYVTANYAAQFKKLDVWRDAHQTELYDIIEPGRHILYGEWVYSKHSIHYTDLPGYFIAFDLFDKKTGKFSSREKLEKILEGTTIPQIRLIAKNKFKNMDQIIKLVNSESAYYKGKLEGVYVRICDENYTLKRAKIVRSDFICGDTHWSKNKCIENTIKIEN